MVLFGVDAIKIERLFLLKLLTVYGKLKTVNNMANIKLTFLGTQRSETQEHKLECYANSEDEIFLSIDIEDYPPSYICLDIATSIKLAKVLRSEINLIKEV